MKIGLFGYGKMGRLIAQLAEERGHSICAVITSSSAPDWKEADVMIDFSQSNVVLKHLHICIQENKPLIIGTTGWDSQLQEAEAAVKDSTIGCLYSPNFSIGIFLFQQILGYAASLIHSFDSYDLCGVEYHHQAKKDAPSGTAKTLAKEIASRAPRFKDFSFTTVRCGFFPGTHTLAIDGLNETITLSHEARNRQSFAEGALLAAEWIQNKKGFFFMKDLLKEHPHVT